MNPAGMLKFMEAKKKFDQNHPKFGLFLKNVIGNGVPEGTVFEIKVTKPGQQEMITNLKVTESDLELIQTLKEMR